MPGQRYPFDLGKRLLKAHSVLASVELKNIFLHIKWTVDLSLQFYSCIMLRRACFMDIMEWRNNFCPRITLNTQRDSPYHKYGWQNYIFINVFYHDSRLYKHASFVKFWLAVFWHPINLKTHFRLIKPDFLYHISSSDCYLSDTPTQTKLSLHIVQTEFKSGNSSV